MNNPTRLERRALGTTGIEVSAIGLGCSSLGGVLDRESESQSLRTVRMALDRGINFFDTADAYSMGRSEELLGQAVRGQRDRVVIATKGGSRFSPAWKAIVDSRSALVPLRKVLKPFKRYFNLVRHTQKRYDYSPSHLRRALETSLKRLDTDYIDLYQIYNPTRADLEAGAFIDTLERFKREGKIRYYGIACHNAEDALQCLRYPGVSAVQLAISLADQEALDNVVPRLVEEGVGVIGCEPLAQGFLTTNTGRTLAEESARGRSQIRSRQQRASQFKFLIRPDRTLAQAAMQFAIRVPGISSVIPGMILPKQLEENLGALTATPLTQDELQRIRDTGRAFT
jgi:aryl-alcohol dehydrogenase-like predicted oxidoreductase